MDSNYSTFPNTDDSIYTKYNILFNMDSIQPSCNICIHVYYVCHSICRPHSRPLDKVKGDLVFRNSNNNYFVYLSYK